MKVLFICDDEDQARYVRANHQKLEDGIRNGLFWGNGVEFSVIASLREPTPKELTDMINTLDGEKDCSCEYTG